MLSTKVKKAQEHTARARNLLQRGNLANSLHEAAAALMTLTDKTIFGQPKITIQTLIQNYLQELSRNSEFKKFLYSQDIYNVNAYLAYKAGKEPNTALRLADAAKRLGYQDNSAEQLNETKKKANTRDLLKQGLELLHSDEATKGKVILRRLVEQNPNNADMAVTIAQAFFKQNLLSDTYSLCRNILEANPGNARIYSIAVDCCLKMVEYEKAEDIFNKAIRRFGGHPKTYLRMAKMYLDWKKWSEAYDKAKQAMDEDSSLKKEAEPIMEAAGKRIFTRQSPMKM